MHSQQLKGMQSFKQGMRKWYHFTTEGIRKGYPFCEEWYKKAEGAGPRSGASLYNKIYYWSANNIARAGFRGCLHWREEDPSTRKILEGGSTLHWVYMQKFWSVWYPNTECLRRNLKWRATKTKIQFGPFCSLYWR